MGTQTTTLIVMFNFEGSGSQFGQRPCDYIQIFIN